MSTSLALSWLCYCCRGCFTSPSLDISNPWENQCLHPNHQPCSYRLTCPRCLWKKCLQLDWKILSVRCYSYFMHGNCEIKRFDCCRDSAFNAAVVLYFHCKVLGHSKEGQLMNQDANPESLRESDEEAAREVKACSAEMTCFGWSCLPKNFDEEEDLLKLSCHFPSWSLRCCLPKADGYSSFSLLLTLVSEFSLPTWEEV